MWSYDLNTGSGTRLPDLAYGRANCISIAVGDFIYVFGGRQDVDMCGYAQDTSARYVTFKYPNELVEFCVKCPNITIQIQD